MIRKAMVGRHILLFQTSWTFLPDRGGQRFHVGTVLIVRCIEIDYGDGRPLGLNVAGTEERVAPISEILDMIADPIDGVLRVSDSPGADLRPINNKGVPAITHSLLLDESAVLEVR